MSDEEPRVSSGQLVLEFEVGACGVDGAGSGTPADDGVADDCVVDGVGGEESDDVVGTDVEGAESRGEGFGALYDALVGAGLARDCVNVYRVRRGNVGIVGEEERNEVDVLKGDVWIGRLVDFGRHDGNSL